MIQNCMEPTVKDIIAKAKLYLPSLNEQRVLDAFEFANKAHSGQTRFSGEPYIIHPLNVAYLLLDYHPDEASIISALLHDVAEDTPVTIEEIGNQFGEEVASLCNGLMKLSKVRSRLNDPQVENLRKLFLAMTNDIRVVMLKLCDRLHNMSTLDFVRPEKKIRIAQETLNIYAPIAARLGIYRLKMELEDMCFKHLNPEGYAQLSEQLKKTVKWREKYMDEAKKLLQETLQAEGLHAEVDGRVKSLYSIYRKMQRKSKMSVDDIFDIFAMRITLPDIYKYGKEYTGHVYTALGIVHNHFTPLANRFKDYVAVPKVNGYRSLHTTVVGLGPKTYTQPTEIQIRTEGMHQHAEYGIAAHWIYEEEGVIKAADYNNQQFYKRMLEDTTGDDMENVMLQQQTVWLNDLQKVEQETKGNQELLDNLKSDLFQDRIFVLTPRGDVKDLPAGATTIDFAYAVHTEVGNHCTGSKVNGTIVPIDYVLRNGEVVEILTRKNARPSLSWLSFAKTTFARNRIRTWFRNLDGEGHMKEGRQLLNAKLQQLGLPPLDINLSILKKYDDKDLTIKGREALVSEVGLGITFASTIVRKLFPPEQLLGSSSKPIPAEFVMPVQTGEEVKMLIGGAENVPYSFVNCCNPKPGDDLIGYTTRGRGVSVHKRSCAVVRNSELQRLVTVQSSQNDDKSEQYSVHIVIEADDRVGLVRDISSEFANSNVNILHFFQDPPHNGRAIINFVLDIQDVDQLERVLSNLEKIPSVRRACKVN